MPQIPFCGLLSQLGKRHIYLYFCFSPTGDILDVCFSLKSLPVLRQHWGGLCSGFQILTAT